MTITKEKVLTKKEKALLHINRKIAGTKAWLNPRPEGHFDDRIGLSRITKKQVTSEVARLEAARKDVEGWSE